MTKPAPKQDDPAQSKRFIELARQLGAEGDEESFGKAFDKVAAGSPERPKPVPRKPKSAKKR